MFSKILKLLKNPKEEYKNIIPYLKSRKFFFLKMLYEFFGIDKFSKPYPGHENLLKYLGKRNGFFVQGGGNDGLNSDPTYYLEKFLGWSGIIIEPLPVFRQCVKNRKKSQVYNFALVSSDFNGKSIQLIDCNAMSVVKDSFDGYEEWVKSGEIAQKMKSKEISVPVITLNSVIDKYFLNYPQKEIDLLVLDLEGYELNALNGFDINKYKPRFILLEIHDQVQRDLIEKYLGEKYVLLEQVDPNDYLYKLR